MKQPFSASRKSPGGKIRISQRGDIRHTFILFYILLFSIWGIFSALIASAQTASGTFASSTTYSTSSVDNSSVQFTNYNDFIGNLIHFHTENISIDIFLAAIGLMFGAYIGATVFFGIGG